MVISFSNMLFDTLTLECFLAVYETRSVTKAANRIGRTQSAVSQQLLKLEAQVGKQLFLRSKTLSLTHEGEILLPYAKKIIQLNREALDKFTEPDLIGEVKFGVPEDFVSVFLSDILVEYSSIHPRVLLHIECDLTLNLYQNFKDNKFDLVLVKMNRPEDFPNGIEIWSEPLEWVGNPELFDPSLNKPIPLVLAPSPCVYRSRALNSLERKQVRWTVVFSSHSYAGTIAAVRAGMGITVLPRNMVPKDLNIIKSNKKIPKLEDNHVSLLKHNNLDPAVNSLEKFVLDKLRKQHI